MLTIVLVIAAITAIVLVAPVRIDLELDIEAEPPRRLVRMQAQWLFFAWRSGKGRRANPKKAPRQRAHSAGRPRSNRVLAALRTQGFLGRACRLAIDLLRAVAPRTVDCWVRFGFEDPVSTGVLFGAAHAAMGLVQATGVKVRLEPEYSGPAFAGHARLVWAVRPGAVLWPVGTFVASPITWRAAFAAIRQK